MPIGLTLGTTFVLGAVLRRFYSDTWRAGLATSLVVILFFGFNPATSFLNRVLEFLSWYWVHRGFDVHPLLTTCFLGAIATPIFLSIQGWIEPKRGSQFLNVFSMVLILFPGVTSVNARMHEPAHPIALDRQGIQITSRPEKLPDIYHIVLDAYARSDVMRELFDFDNSAFLDRLEQKGFYVARKSQSNYCQTTLSLASTLNCDYLDSLLVKEVHDKDPLGELIGDNLVVKTLRPLGYKFVAFATGYELTECTDADFFLAPHHPDDNFQMLFFRMTPLRYLPFRTKYWDFYSSTRDRTRFVLDHLPDIASYREPTFTLAHIVSPHHPFVLGENGEDVAPSMQQTGFQRNLKPSYSNSSNYRDGYRKQAIFLTKQIEKTIEAILARSPEPPIIILQSDHGSGLRHHLDDLEQTDLRERMSILNTYYFPNRNYEGLTQKITPVNTFRILFNNNFGAGMKLLANRSYFSTYAEAYKMTDVTERLESNRDQGRKFTLPGFYPGMTH